MRWLALAVLLGAPARADPPPQTPAQKIAWAERERETLLAEALRKVDDLLRLRPADPASPLKDLSADDQSVVDAMNAWMLTSKMDEDFWDRLARVRTMMDQNRALTGRPPLRDAPRCKDYAYTRDTKDPSKGIDFGPAFMSASSNCRREVMIHEFFHFIVGPQHHYTTSDPNEAIRCPHHLAELVSQIATGVAGSCAPSGKN